MKSNKGYIIAVIKGIDKKEIVGYRLWFNGQVKKVPWQELYSAMYRSDCVENAKVKDGQIVGTNGSLDRYATINPLGVTLKDTLVIIKKIGLTDRDKKVTKTAYQVSHPNGVTRMVPSWHVISYAENNGIANGKIVTKGDTKFISAIEGEYPYEEILAGLFFMDYNAEDFRTADEQRTIDDALDKVKRDRTTNYETEDEIFRQATVDFKAGVKDACKEMGISIDRYNGYTKDGITTMRTQDGHYATVPITSNNVTLSGRPDSDVVSTIVYVAARPREGNVAYIEIRAIKDGIFVGLIDLYQINLPAGDEDAVTDIMYEEGKQQAYKMNRTNSSGNAIEISNEKI